jgi:hypothetical protein
LRVSLTRHLTALASACVVVAFTLDQVRADVVFTVGVGLIPVIVFEAVTWHAGKVSFVLLSVVLGAYTLLWVAGTFVYDTSSTGGLVFLFVPVYAVVGLLLVAVVVRPVATIITRRKLFRS